jgi:hypothetical protein
MGEELRATRGGTSFVAVRPRLRRIGGLQIAERRKLARWQFEGDSSSDAGRLKVGDTAD